METKFPCLMPWCLSDVIERKTHRSRLKKWCYICLKSKHSLLFRKKKKPKEVQGVSGSANFGSRGAFDGEGKQTLDAACTALTLARAIGM